MVISYSDCDSDISICSNEEGPFLGDWNNEWCKACIKM